MPHMTYETLLVEERDGITTITVNRPDALNALNATVLAELDAVTTAIAGARATARGVIITGAGDKAFIAGADIKAMSQMSPDEAEAFGRLGQRVSTQLEALPVPVIACVNGFALGGGCEMAMASDFIYATGNARFGQPEVSLGLIPGFGGCVRLIRYVGPGHAKELILSGRHIKAEEAARLGLVNKVFETKDEMLAAAAATLGEIATKSPAAVATAKAVINATHGLSTEAALDAEAAAFRGTFSTNDMREGTTAFLEKRPPSFTGD
jgi:enoyl-CoA hydratase